MHSFVKTSSEDTNVDVPPDLEEMGRLVTVSEINFSSILPSRLLRESSASSLREDVRQKF